jgi:hypothetical protein
MVRRQSARLTTDAPDPPMLLHSLTHMLTCKEVSRLLSQGEERRLALFERVKLRLHLTACDACSRFARQLAFMRRAMQRYRS